ncbi:MAG TPA: ATP-binding protein [Polyangia bacterium]
MANRKDAPTDKAALRIRAEEWLSGRTPRPGSTGPDTAEDLRRPMHELQVHQIELELQNEELQAARAELELGFERYADLYDFAPVGYVTLDSGGTIRKMNLAGARLLGQDRSRLVGARFALFVAHESSCGFANFMQKVLETHNKEVCEIALCPERSAPIWVHVEAMASRNNGRECRVVLVDVSERKRAEHALAQSEQRFRNLFQSMDEGFMLAEMIDDQAGQPVDFRYLEVNTAFARQAGLPVERIVGRTSREVIPGLETHWIETYSRVTRSGRAERIENQVESLGKHFEIHAWRTDINRFAATFTDVTALRETEESLRAAQRLESIGRLAGGIAHDFNNMLAIIINYSDLAMQDLNEPDALLSSLTEIRTAANRAAALTRQLLAFGRKQTLQPQVLDLNKLVGGMEGMLRRLLGEDLSLTLVLALGLGKVMADPGQIEQVLMNLVVNSRDAMPQGGKLTIETANAECDDACTDQHPEVTSGPHVRLSVTDNGCGMDAHTRARLGEPFFTTKAVGKGTGLGLATAYGIVRQSGGVVRVRSEPGNGTTFTVLLPRDLSGAETFARTITLTTRAVRAETILVVEDEETLRTLVERVLCRAGYIVVTAASGHEALHIFEQQKESVHLLLTDVVMPEMNGKELADRLVLQAPKLRVLYMSGYTDEAILRRGGLDPGMNFLSKPFNPAQLTRMVRKILEGEAKPEPTNENPRAPRSTTNRRPRQEN